MRNTKLKIILTLLISVLGISISNWIINTSLIDIFRSKNHAMTTHKIDQIEKSNDLDFIKAEAINVYNNQEITRENNHELALIKSYFLIIQSILILIIIGLVIKELRNRKSTHYNK